MLSLPAIMLLYKVRDNTKTEQCIHVCVEIRSWFLGVVKIVKRNISFYEIIILLLSTGICVIVTW